MILLQLLYGRPIYPRYSLNGKHMSVSARSGSGPIFVVLSIPTYAIYFLDTLNQYHDVFTVTFVSPVHGDPRQMRSGAGGTSHHHHSHSAHMPTQILQVGTVLNS